MQFQYSLYKIRTPWLRFAWARIVLKSVYELMSNLVQSTLSMHQSSRFKCSTYTMLDCVTMITGYTNQQTSRRRGHILSFTLYKHMHKLCTTLIVSKYVELIIAHFLPKCYLIYSGLDEQSSQDSQGGAYEFFGFPRQFDISCYVLYSTTQWAGKNKNPFVKDSKAEVVFQKSAVHVNNTTIS